MEIYEWRANVSGFRSLMFADEADTDMLYRFNGQPIQGWSAPAVAYLPEDVEERLPIADFMDLATIPAFRSASTEPIRDVLEAHGELLPLESSDGDFLAYNVTTVVNALLEAESKLTRFSDGRLLRLDEPVFSSDAIGQAVIFKIPQKSFPEIFVTDEFVKRVAKAELTGFRFVPLGPARLRFTGRR